MWLADMLDAFWEWAVDKPGAWICRLSAWNNRRMFRNPMWRP